MIAQVLIMTPRCAGQMGKRHFLTLREAAELTGFRRKVIRDRVARGDIAVRVLGSGRNAKLRLTESALVEAGLLAGELAPAVRNDELAELIRLVREQQARLSALEDQRFQLAGQLGAALERTLALQNELLELTASVQAHSPIWRETGKSEPRPKPVAEQSEPARASHVGAERAQAPPDKPTPARTIVAAKFVVGKLATGSQRGRAGIARLRTAQWRPGK
jgi:hypothetical protein